MRLKFTAKSISEEHNTPLPQQYNQQKLNYRNAIKDFKMESKNTASCALLLLLGLLFFSLVSATSPTPYLPGSTTSTYYSAGKCNPLNLGVCANVLNLVDVVVGSPPTLPCCSLIEGLVDLEAAVCLCTAIRANILGINLNVPVSLSLVLNNCRKKVPSGFECY